MEFVGGSPGIARGFVEGVEQERQAVAKATAAAKADAGGGIIFASSAHDNSITSS